MHCDPGPHFVLKAERLTLRLRRGSPLGDPDDVLDGTANQSEGGQQPLFRDRLRALRCRQAGRDPERLLCGPFDEHRLPFGQCLAQDAGVPAHDPPQGAGILGEGDHARACGGPSVSVGEFPAVEFGQAHAVVIEHGHGAEQERQDAVVRPSGRFRLAQRQRFSFFSGMMDWAVVNEIIGRNPCKKVKGAGSRAKEIREQKSTARRLTTREVLAMLDAAPPRYRAMLWLMAGCGLRLGEAMAVSRDQIDFKAETLRVDFQIAEDGDTASGKNSAIQRRHIKARDEGEPGRTVPLPPNVAFELRRHIKNHGVWGPERLLFPNVTRTGYLYASYFYPKIWMEALGKGQVKYCKAHSLRHYYGSRLLYAGVPENDVADWMGHSSTDVLREHYHYIFEGAEQRGRAAIATMLTPGADDPTEASEVA